ncbi:hypothetical protein Tco_1168735, partial [Tanacetum coccineum]
MYHKKNVDYAYLLWEDFVYQVETKNSKRGNEMYYPRFTKVIVNFFMTKDQSIPRRNKVNWHFARDDHMFTTIKVVSRHEDTQLYNAILPNELTNEAIKDFESYKEYYAIASGAEPPKTKASVKKTQVKSDKTKTPPTAKGKRLKTLAKAAKPTKKKQPAKTSKAKGLTVLSEVALTEAKQMKLAKKGSLIESHSSHASGSGADEGTVAKNDDDDDNDDDSDNDDDNDNDNDDDEADNQDGDGQEYDVQDDEDQDDDFSTHDEEDKEEDSFDPRVQTPSHVESTDDEDSDEEIQDANVKGDEHDEEETNEEDEANELYRDVNVNLVGRDTEMTDAPRTIIQTTKVIEDTHVISTPVNPEGQQQSSSVSSGFISNMLNPSPDIIPTPANVPSSSLQDLPNFGSLFGFDHRLKTLETDFSELKQTNQFAAAVSSIPGIVDAYLANKMHEAVKTVVQLQFDRLRDEAQAKNADFINKLDDNIKKIIKDQVKEQVKAQVSKILPKIEKIVNEQLKAEVLTCSSNESKTSHANLYKALVDTYESDKLILDTYGEIVSFKRRRDKEDKDEEPSARSNRGSKRRRAGKELESTKEPRHTAKDLEEPTHLEFETGVTKDQPDEETSQLPDWFQKPAKPLTLDRDWNNTLPNAHGPVQPWLSSLSQMEDPRKSFNDLIDTPLEFSAFMITRLKVDTLTPELLVGLTFELMKGSYKSLVELEYFFEEVYKATTDQLYWNNPEVYLSGGVSSRTYTTSMTKTKAADYGNIKWIEDLGRKRQQFYGFAANRESTRDVYSKRRIIAVTKLHIVEWHNYKHLDWITVYRDDDKLNKFKEGNFNRLRIQDIEDMLLLLVQGILTNLTVEERLAFNVSMQI